MNPMTTIVANKALFKLHYKIPTIEVQTKMWSHGLAGADHSLPFGFESDNYVGAFLQMNTPKASWITFFRDCRLLPQIKMAEMYFDIGMNKQCIKLLDHLDSYLVEPGFPLLIHGDLWSGNAVYGPDEKAGIWPL